MHQKTTPVQSFITSVNNINEHCIELIDNIRNNNRKNAQMCGLNRCNVVCLLGWVGLQIVSSKIGLCL